MDSNLLFIVLVVFTPALYAWGMPPSVPRRKSLNTKRLSPYSRSKDVAESFRGWDWAVSLLGRPLQHRHAIRIGCGFGKRIIADSLKKGRLDYGYISALDHDG